MRKRRVLDSRRKLLNRKVLMARKMMSEVKKKTKKKKRKKRRKRARVRWLEKGRKKHLQLKGEKYHIPWYLLGRNMKDI